MGLLLVILVVVCGVGLVSGGGAWVLACLDLAVLNPVVEFGRVEANEFADLQIRDSAFFDQSSNESWLDVHEFGYLGDVE